MAQIQVTSLTFSYDGSADDVLKDVNFNIDTDWKLGLIGRNGNQTFLWEDLITMAILRHLPALIIFRIQYLIQI